MAFQDLPKRTKFGRVVPKNAFDDFTNTRQKKLFTDFVQRINWTHKLSKETTNLSGDTVKEIQVFKVELKEKVKITKVLEIIQKSIPYHLIIEVTFNGDSYFVTSQIHPHPTNDNQSVIDWSFESEWVKSDASNYQINLKTSLDQVHRDFCIQLTGRDDLKDKPISVIVENQIQIDGLKKDIARLESAISKEKQFNRKVQLNLELNEKKTKLKSITQI